MTRKPRENRLFASHILLIFPRFSFCLSPAHPKEDWGEKKKKKSLTLSGPGSGKGIFEVDTSGSLGECGIPGPRAGGGAGTSRDSRNPRRSGVWGYGCDSGQGRLLSASEETVQQLAGEEDPVIFPREPLQPSHNNPVSRRPFFSFGQEFPGSVPHPFRCSRIVHRRRPRTLPLNRESLAFTLSCGHHHLPRVPALVMHNSTSRNLFPP